MDIKSKVIQAIHSKTNQFNASTMKNLLNKVDGIVLNIEKMQTRFKNDTVKLDEIIDLRLDIYERTLVKEFDHVALVADNYENYFIYLKTQTGYKLIEDLCTDKDDSLKAAEMENKIRTNGYTSIDSISFPSGQIVFTNFFPSTDGATFNIEEDVKYSPDFSINSKRGQQNSMYYMAYKHNCGYAQLGNTSCAVYKKSNDEIILSTAYLCYYDEETDAEIDIDLPEGYTYIGTFDCSVWRTEFIDKTFLNNSNVDNDRFKDMEKVIVDVTPGEWSFKNHYFSCNNSIALSKKEIPVWVELKRNK